MTTRKGSASKTASTGRKAASTVTTTVKDPAKAREARIANALKDAPDPVSAAVELATAEATAEKKKKDAEDAGQQVEAAREAEKTAKDAAKDADKAVSDRARYMLVLAARLNPTLSRPKSGPAPKDRAAVISAVVAATGQDRSTVSTRIARWIAAGTLSLSTGLDVRKAATLANSMLGSNGDANKFWGLVANGEIPETDPDTSRKARPNAGKNAKGGDKGTAPVVTVEKAREVVAAADAERVQKMTPAQRGAELLTALLTAHKALADALKDGSATLSKAQATRWETTMAAVPVAK